MVDLGFIPIRRTSWRRRYRRRSALDRINNRIDQSFEFKQHFIRGLARMRTRGGAAAVTMALALGHLRTRRCESMRSSSRFPSPTPAGCPGARPTCPDGLVGEPGGLTLEFIAPKELPSHRQVSSVDSLTGLPLPGGYARETDLKKTCCKLCVVLLLSFSTAGSWTDSSLAVAASDSPLFNVIAENDLAAVQRLLSVGVDVNGRDDQGDTALHVAIANQASSIVVETLLWYGADPNATNRRDQSVLQVAMIRKAEPVVVEGLLRYGADPNVTDAEGRTALLSSLTRTIDPVIFTSLLQYGADPNVKNGAGDTTLTLAIKQNLDFRFFETLLRHGANPNATSGAGETMLTLAIKQNLDFRFFESLLRHGANPNATNGAGETMLTLAIKQNLHFRLVETLLRHGADPNVMDSAGKSALNLAATDKIREALRRYGADQKEWRTQ